MVNFDCSDEYAASLLWTQRAQLRDGYVRHRCAQADIKLSGKNSFRLHYFSYSAVYDIALNLSINLNP